MAFHGISHAKHTEAHDSRALNISHCSFFFAKEIIIFNCQELEKYTTQIWIFMSKREKILYFVPFNHLQNVW